MNGAARIKQDDRWLVSRNRVALLRRRLARGGRNAVTLGSLSTAKTRSILELEGLGKEIWEGVDVETYIRELRDEWEPR